MKIIKNIICVIVPIILSFIVAYSCVSFIRLDTNFTHWDSADRVAIILFTLFSLFVSLLIVIAANTQSKFDVL